MHFNKNDRGHRRSRYRMIGNSGNIYVLTKESVVAKLSADEETCTLTGTGPWEERAGDGMLTLHFRPVRGNAELRAPGTYSGIELAGHTKPYSLYWILGDPDSGTGLWLTSGAHPNH